MFVINYREMNVEANDFFLDLINIQTPIFHKTIASVHLSKQSRGKLQLKYPLKLLQQLSAGNRVYCLYFFFDNDGCMYHGQTLHIFTKIQEIFEFLSKKIFLY